MQIKKPTLKHLLYFLFSLWVIFVLWYARGYFFDETPDKGRENFYAHTDSFIPDMANAAIGVAGLDAPENVDIIQRGRYVQDLIERSFDYDDNYLSQKKLDAMPKLAFVGLEKADEIACNQPAAIQYDLEQCINSTKAIQLLEQNKVLLNRYLSLLKLIDWQGTLTNGQLLINLNKLLSMQIRLLATQEKWQEAYQLWRDNHVFIGRVLSHENSAIGHAVFLVNQGLNLNSLEFLLYENPEIGLAHTVELDALLTTRGLAPYNLKGMTRGEYAFFDKNLLKRKEVAKTLHVEYIRNRIYRVHLEFLQKAQLPASTLSESRLELADKYSPSTTNILLRTTLPHGLSNLIVSQFIQGKGRELLLVESMHSKNALMSLLNLNVKIHQQNISKNRAQAFLNQAGKEYECPFTARPMTYDAKMKKIYCENPETKARVAEVRLQTNKQSIARSLSKIFIK